MADERLAEQEASEQEDDEQHAGEQTAAEQDTAEPSAAEQAVARGSLIQRARAARVRTPARASRARLSRPMAQSVRDYTASISYDKRLAPYDVAGSIAHTMMLAKQGIISRSEGRQIVAGLRRIADEIGRGIFYFRDEYEDVHLNVETRLIEIVGDVGGKLHTARSRNDQIALDMRLFTKDAIKDAINGLNDLRGRILDKAEAHINVVMPGYTHMQRGQPILLAHHLLAYSEMFERDSERFRDALRRTDVMPLGSGALAGAPYPLDRPYVARRLGFSKLSNNSMDAVSDRDFVIEYHAAASLAMMHLSRLAEELILWSTQEFGFVTLDDAYATGSSMMPQKKNPDLLELCRGKTATVLGHASAMAILLKGLPSSYNRDLQQDKEHLFPAVDTVGETLGILTLVASRMRVVSSRIGPALERGFLTATDLAEHLVSLGVPFRTAHEQVGRLVAYCVKHNRTLRQLSLREIRKLAPRCGSEVQSVLKPEGALDQKFHSGSTGLASIRQQIARWEDRLRTRGNGNTSREDQP